ncbi:acetyl/propionyl/methylcrotonyl-CoA carboxylase subunit alpha [Variovorax sp. dw_308]|uniref:acetyl-CoA carboxylase biotin carboxylase subunit n=1 Tax=Variovorax sp. dw_308 TaxID=2721546 RepID=UPI001C43BB77|nr:biotin carboxylase N-terminal domain-containing protein [Variovorax sp. dw_308]
MRRILIANRGEIACRVMRTCERLGIETVAIYSPADASALHVALATSSIALPADAPREGYANAAVVIEAARKAGADAVHPGYGFLSENSAFARAVEAARMLWIGPRPDTIDDMGNKNRARDLAEAAGLPVLPGSAPIQAGDASFHARAGAIGYPVLVKAAAGGGGIGMKRVDVPSALAAAVENVQSHAARLYGDASVFIEKLVARARHVEIQVFGFGDGEAIHLYERECSIQRRYQKVMEESSGPNLDAGQLEKMRDAAVALARRERYTGPGTVEFLYDDETGAFYFLEMNTRIQVEHPVTEMVTGIDLIEQQIRLADGDALSDLRAGPPERAGHAIEARLYAEDPRRSYMPSPGTLTALVLPTQSDSVRVDTGVRQGDTVSPFYDPMIAKIIGRGRTRSDAIDALASGLAQVEVAGLKSNIELLRALLTNEAFVAGRIHTGFLQEHAKALLPA